MVSLDIYDEDSIQPNNYLIIIIDFVSSKDNIADPLTKGLTREVVESSLRRMRLKPII